MGMSKKELDQLNAMFTQQESFMRLLQKKRNFPEFPVDLTTKDGQKVVKEYAHECMHELFEAVHMLKNSKSHRVTDVKEFDMEKYKEELVDALHYFIEICILSGITPETIYQAYMEKGWTNVERIEGGY